MKRYKPALSPDGDHVGMYVVPDGEYVSYKDVEHPKTEKPNLANAVLELASAIRDLKTEIAHLRKHRS